MHGGFLKRFAAPIAALALLLGLCAWLFAACRARTEGHFTYALDDAYIHMAIARHVAEHGVWGVTPYAFSSSSSSILWTLLLSLSFALAGVREWIPLVLNLTFVVVTLVWADGHLRSRLGPAGRFTMLAAIVLFPPLPVVAFGGMEHTLHALLTLVFLARAADRLAAGDEASQPVDAPLVTLAALLPLARYEGLFAVFVVCVLLLTRRRVLDAVRLGIAALIPVGIFGAWSAAQGWLPVPTTVVLKGVTSSALQTLLAIPLHLKATRPLAGLMVLAGLLLARAAFARAPMAPRDRLLLWLFVWTSLLHLQLARVGWFYRYEAYLIVLGIVALAAPLLAPAPANAAAPGARPSRPLMAVALNTLALLFAVSVVAKRVPVLRSVPPATQNIYQQQVQTGRFLASAYSGQAVTLSDIGAVNFLADLHAVDLMGLGDIEAARFRLAHGGMTAAEADRLSRERGARIAISYERWFHDPEGVTLDGVPARWGEPVGRWAIRECVVCGAESLAFFGLGDAERDTLAARLKAFAPRLPAGVEQSGRYVTN